jgi:Tfp pilus assembly protein PilF
MLLDFNLSLDERVENGKIGGTLPYMSPEQIWSAVLGHASLHETVDHRCDLFSLGVVLYELLTGRMPFGPVPVHLPSEQMAEHLLQQQRAGPLPLMNRTAGIDPALAAVIEGCLAYDAAKRSPSAEQLAVALRRQLSPARRSRRWIAKHPLATRASATAAALLLAVGVGYVAMRPPYPQRLLAKAQAQLRQGSHAEAVGSFNDCLQLDPHWNEARMGRALALQRQGEFLQAEAEYCRLKIPPQPGRIAALRAYCLASAGRYDEALRASEEARRHNYTTAALLANMGYCYNRLGNITQASEILDECLQIKPAMPSALYQRAFVRLQQALAHQDYSADEGLLDIDRFLQQYPDCAEAHQLAVQLLATALEDHPQRIELLLKHLRFAVRHGKSFRTEQEMTTFASLQNDPRVNEVLAGPVGTYRENPHIRLVEPTID